ncbi:MAG: hypothetical protein Q4D06_06210 [Coriobacteriia bacterium]|nr:hypothetical protein [Coriobacteriia bacterium]
MARESVVSGFDPDVLDMDMLVKNIQSSSRLSRQKAAATFHKLSLVAPERVVPHLDLLFAALDNDESRTRSSVLETLLVMSEVDASLVDKASGYAEEALFDEDNGVLRLMGMRFLCKIGAESPEASLKVWSSLDEALQCFHGDNEFNDMLLAVAEFAAGNVDDAVKAGLKERLSFDAEHSRGMLRKRAQAVLDAIS